MGRRYKVLFEGVAVSAPQDLVTIIGATAKAVRVLRQWCGFTDTTLPTAQGLQYRGRFLPSTVTTGSGGTTPTPSKVDQGDAAATFTAHANDTSKATTSGTAVIVEEAGLHIYSGYDVPLGGVPVMANQAYVFELLSTVPGTVHLSGGVEVEEIG
jgi:hypothetical protein